MKTNPFKLALLSILSIMFIGMSYAQTALDGSNFTKDDTSVFSNVNVDDLAEGVDLYSIDEAVLHVDYYEEQTPEEVVAFALTMLAIGAGIGFGDNDTLWCLHAGFYQRLALFTQSALYGVFAVVYNGQSNDIGSSGESSLKLKRSLIDFQLKLLMFTAISTLMEVSLVYGILFAYGIGNETFDNFKTDINQFTAAAVIGFYLALSATISLAMHTNLFAYVDTKFKPESGNDYNQDSTRFLLNKGSVFAVSLLFHLNRRARSMPE